MRKGGQKNSIWAESYSRESMEESRHFPKSSWYREDLAQLLGPYITLDRRLLVFLLVTGKFSRKIPVYMSACQRCQRIPDFGPVLCRFCN